MAQAIRHRQAALDDATRTVLSVFHTLVEEAGRVVRYIGEYSRF
jgi:hypothetical protein